MKNKNEISFLVKEKEELLPFLLKHFEGKSKNNIKSFLSNKQVLVNKQIIKNHDYLLKEKDEVRVRLHYIKYRKENIQILYEDEEFIVVIKPSHLLCIRDSKSKEENLYHLVSEYVKLTNKKNKIFIVHRLDKDTSGIVLFAKTERTKEYLQKYWNDKVDRFYMAMVHNIPKKDSSTIVSYLKEDKTHRVYSTNDKNHGEYASTYYEVLEKQQTKALLGIKLNTGKKNQIRVHMQDIGCPIIGDKKYGIKDNVNDMCLYAYKLSFFYNKERYTFEAKDIFFL